jgi:CBS domain-containing protein
MPANTIQHRVYEFLKDHAPFSYCSAEFVKELAALAQVQYYQPEEIIFKEGDPPATHFFVVKQGAVDLLKQNELTDRCGEGDVFGVRSLITQGNYALTAQAREETLLYAVPVQQFRPALSHNSQVALFFAAKLARQTPGVESAGLPAPESVSGFISPLSQRLPSGLFQELLTCSPDTPLQQAAQQMSDWRVGSIIVIDQQRHPRGIITNTDLRNWAATGKLPLSAPVSKVMSSPVVTAGQHQSVADVLIRMMQHDVHHLCITKDGSTDSPALGMITDHDLLLLQENNPTVILRKIHKAKDISTLAELRDQAETMVQQYIVQGTAIRTVASLMTVMNDAITTKCIASAQASLKSEGYSEPEAAFCWLSLGSEGRGEQLLRTDQDNALVYQDPPNEKAEATQAYYQELGKRVVASLEQCGFSRCSANMMASNPQWCKPLSGWKEQFKDWIQVPEPESLLQAAIFFDFRATAGDSSLANTLRKYVFAQIKAESLFMHYLANNALLNPPPLSFFRKFVVEKSGDHKDNFDIKRRALMPLTDAARVLAYEAQLPDTTNTQQRLELVASTDTSHAALYQEAADAYDKLLEIRAREGLRQHDSGRYIDPGSLTHLERELLRSIFGVIRDVQQVLRHRFQLDYFRR